QRDVARTSALLVSHRLQDGFMLASHYYDVRTNRMQAVDGKPMQDIRTSFMVLREGKVIFDGTALELGRIHDPYIREYIAYRTPPTAAPLIPLVGREGFNRLRHFNSSITKLPS